MFLGTLVLHSAHATLRIWKAWNRFARAINNNGLAKGRLLDMT